jgi:hypothetical protein
MDAAATFVRGFAWTRSHTALAVDDLLARVSPDDPKGSSSRACSEAQSRLRLRASPRQWCGVYTAT